jgi:hypothetical protein
MNLIAIFFLTIMANAAFSNAFTVSSIPRAHVARFGESTQMNMGFFDGIAKAFGNEEVSKANLCTIALRFFGRVFEGVIPFFMSWCWWWRIEDRICLRGVENFLLTACLHFGFLVRCPT